MRRPLVATLAFLGSAVVFPGRAAAQGPTPSEIGARLRLGASAAATRIPSATARSLVTLPDSAAKKGTDYTVVGLLIGAGLGFAAGWAFYDVMCEAVDNRCAESRAGHVVLGTGAGGALGALIGSLAD